MGKPSSIKTCEPNGWKQVRIGKKFHQELKRIRKSILINTDIDEISFEEVTNILVRHNSWTKIANDAENIKEEEIIKYAKH